MSFIHGENKVTSERFLAHLNLQKILGVSADQIIGYIDAGELEAINTSRSTKRRFRISPESFKRFCDSRSSQASKVQVSVRANAICKGHQELRLNAETLPGESDRVSR